MDPTLEHIRDKLEGRLYIFGSAFGAFKTIEFSRNAQELLSLNNKTSVYYILYDYTRLFSGNLFAFLFLIRM